MRILPAPRNCTSCIQIYRALHSPSQTVRETPWETIRMMRMVLANRGNPNCFSIHHATFLYTCSIGNDKNKNYPPQKKLAFPHTICYTGTVSKYMPPYVSQRTFPRTPRDEQTLWQYREAWDYPGVRSPLRGSSGIPLYSPRRRTKNARRVSQLP